MVPGQIVVLELDCEAALLGQLVLAERTGSDSFDDRELFVLNLIVKNSVQTGLIGFISGFKCNQNYNVIMPLRNIMYDVIQYLNPKLIWWSDSSINHRSLHSLPTSRSRNIFYLLGSNQKNLLAQYVWPYLLYNENFSYKTVKLKKNMQVVEYEVEYR